VLATASSDEKLARLKEFGLDHGVNYREGDWVAKVRELTNGRGVDLAVDSVGGAVLQGSLESLCYRGRAITVGNAGRDQENRPDLGALSGRNASLTGVFLGAEALMNTARVAPMIGGLLQEIADGKLKVVIDSTYPLSEAAAAHAHIESRKAFGRVLLIP
jgi:NADPH2:quinone reductase